MKVLNKIHNARQIIKKSDLKKAGRNDFSKYDYFTPEQVDKLVTDACTEVKLFNKYQLVRTDLGLVARVEVFDLESDEKETFELATDIPEIKATNIAQQLGGAVTYSKRYLLMSIYDITENALDFDSQKPQPKKEYKDDGKAWLNTGTPEWKEAVKYVNEHGDEGLRKIKTKYKLSKSNQEKLISEAV